MKREQVFSAGLLVLAVGFAVHALALDYVTDDAYISFRYAKNLLAGHGLVYNPGEHVEGYTNFLWTVLLAGVEFVLPGEHMPQIARVLGVLFGCATILVTGDLAREAARKTTPDLALARTTLALLVAPALLAADSSFALWSTAGLESPMFAFLCAAAALAYLRWTRGRGGALWAPLLFALASLTRPDGALLFAVTAAFELVRRRGAVLATVRWSLPFVALFGAWFVWRWNYYGWLLPNTFYVKVGGGSDAIVRGVKYVGRFASSHAWFAFVAPVVLFAKRRPERAHVYLGALVVAHLAFIVGVGGDGLFSYRFCTFLAPILYVLVQAAFTQLFARLPSLIAVACALGVFLNSQIGWQALFLRGVGRWVEPQSELTFPGDGVEHDYLFFDPYFVERQKRAAEWLEANAPPGAWIAATPAGSIAYYSSHPVIDMLGLNDEHIAHVEVGGMGGGRAGHEKGDGKYVLSRKPEYILLGNVAVMSRPLTERDMPGKLVRRSEREIWVDPEFHRDYERVSVDLDRTGESTPNVFRSFTFYRRKLTHGTGASTAR